MAGRSEVVLTEKIKRWIRTVLTHSDLPNETREELRKYTSSRRAVEDRRHRTIPFELVKTVHQHLQSEQGGLYLHELLEGSDVSLPEVQHPPRNPELEQRIQRLKNEQANREYQHMTKNVDASSRREPTESMGSQMRVMNNQLIAVFNFLVTVIGSFVFTYKAIEYSMTTPNFAVQVTGGLITGTIVFFADLYFLLKYSS